MCAPGDLECGNIDMRDAYFRVLHYGPIDPRKRKAVQCLKRRLGKVGLYNTSFPVYVLPRTN